MKRSETHCGVGAWAVAATEAMPHGCQVLSYPIEEKGHRARGLRTSNIGWEPRSATGARWNPEELLLVFAVNIRGNAEERGRARRPPEFDVRCWVHSRKSFPYSAQRYSYSYPYTILSELEVGPSSTRTSTCTSTIPTGRGFLDWTRRWAFDVRGSSWRLWGHAPPGGVSGRQDQETVFAQSRTLAILSIVAEGGMTPALVRTTPRIPPA